MKFTLPRATDRNDVLRVLGREGFTARADDDNPQAIHTNASAAEVAAVVAYTHAAEFAAENGDFPVSLHAQNRNQSNA